jgi:hypothetical protein
MLLADHAHDDGTASWRSVSSMAATLEVSERQVQRAIKDLKIQALIREGDQRLVNHLPSGRRPKVYDLVITSPIAVQEELLTGVTDLSGVTTDVVSLEEEPPLNTSKTYRDNQTGDVTPATSRCSGRRDGIHQFIETGWCLYCPTHQDGRTA